LKLNKGHLIVLEGEACRELIVMNQERNKGKGKVKLINIII